MTTIDLIGFAAGTLTTLSFLPQVIKAWKSHKTDDLSLSMYVIFTMGVAGWLAYGILANSLPVIIANGITLALTIFILFMKIKYSRQAKPE